MRNFIPAGFELTDGEMSRIAGLDEGASLFDYGTAAGARARHGFKVHE